MSETVTTATPAAAPSAPSPPTRDHHIGGAPVTPSSGEYFESTNPATRAVLYRAARGNAADVDRAVTAARDAFEDPR